MYYCTHCTALYIKDTWNFIDFFVYTVFLVWAYIRFAHEESWYYTHAAQQVIGLNGFMMCFRLLHIVRINATFGPLVLMVLVMLVDLIDFLAILGIILFGFTVTMHAMFREMHGYHTIIETFLTLFLAALGEFDFDALQVS
jgi:hypothetical protein